MGGIKCGLVNISETLPITFSSSVLAFIMLNDREGISARSDVSGKSADAILYLSNTSATTVTISWLLIGITSA